MAKTSPNGRESKQARRLDTPQQLALPEKNTDVVRTPLQSYQTFANSVLLDLEHFAGHDDDTYVKLIPGNDGKSWYVNIYFKSGQWAKHYVSAVGHRTALADTLRIAIRKAEEVRAGLRRPSPDRYNG